MNVGKELQTKVAPPCKKHAKPGKSEYPQRILGKSGVNRMCDSVHKKSRLSVCKSIELNTKNTMSLTSFSDLVLGPVI